MSISLNLCKGNVNLISSFCIFYLHLSIIGNTITWVTLLYEI